MPACPIDAYKAIIDQLVTETSRGISERLVAEEGVWSKAPTEQIPNAFVQSLSSEQRGSWRGCFTPNALRRFTMYWRF
jgi:hypothetical protein